MRGLTFAAVAATTFLSFATLFSGCMTSRGICTVHAPGEVRRAVTKNRYRITHVQERLADGRLVNVHSNRRMRDMLDQAIDLDELASYTPGVWSRDGIPVTVTFCDWQNSNPLDWTIIPCILTLGICPYCHTEKVSSRVEISRDDGKGVARFDYSERDNWKMSILFDFGAIQYSEELLARNEFQQCGHGDILAGPHLNGLAHGLAAALAELEIKLNEKGEGK